MLASGLDKRNLFRYTMEMDTIQYAATTPKMYWLVCIGLVDSIFLMIFPQWMNSQGGSSAESPYNVPIEEQSLQSCKIVVNKPPTL